MEQAEVKPVKYRTPLRQAQRELTRGRIKAAARDLFYERHYDTTTMDEIAAAAGLRRSTLYLHYRDKAEILAAIVAEYTPRAQAVLASLPGPAPSIDRLRRWIRTVAAFVAAERVPLSIILELRRDDSYAGTLEDLTDQLISALGTRNPPFRAAAMRDADPMLRARGLLLFQELTFTCEQSLVIGDPRRIRALIEVTAEHFERFLA